MGRLQSIENALVAINETVFQELCDCFLLLKNNNYKMVSRTGSQIGKQKTIKGTPDTFLLLPNGNYIFIEYSTNVTKGISKLKEDIKKCLDTIKPGISIEEIIICINFRLNVNGTNDIQNLLAETNIKLTLYTVDCLAMELHLHYRNLVSEYLGLPMDKGQIVSIETFINEYDKASQQIATTLNNRFLHREKEIKELLNLIEQSDIIIIFGKPGVGKTKLAIEAMREYIDVNPSYNAFCISDKNTPLLDDLYQNLSSDKDNILFVDDANRIDTFSQIIGFYKNKRTGILKILVTVRDYAFPIIDNICSGFIPSTYKIEIFTDEQIIDIIKEKPMEILNPQYHKKIIQIAEGNPRIAIMTALLAKKEQDIYALNDVSDLFDKYFATFINDQGAFADRTNLKILGLIAFFYVIPYKNKELTTSIINNFGINYDTFMNSIEIMEKLELLELHDEYVKISEQNISTYFFYIAFIRDSLLSFETLLAKYFFNNENRFTECVIPANNTFGYQNVMEKLQPILKSYWYSIKNNKEMATKLLSVFWYYLQNEALEYLFTSINAIPESVEKTEETYEIKEESNQVSYSQDVIIKLLSNFFNTQNHQKDAVELAFDYARKVPSKYSELIYTVSKTLIFDIEDERYGFIRQSTLFKSLITGLNDNNKLYTTAFFELSKTFLLFTHQHTKGGRKRTITFYDYPLPNNKYIREFRKNIWENINKYFSTAAFKVLKHYAHKNYKVVKEIIEYDIDFILGIIENHLSPSSFEHCKYVHEQIRFWKRNEIVHHIFTELKVKFTNHLYEMYIKICMNILGSKEDNDYNKFKKLKEIEIKTSFIFKNKIEVENFYQDFSYLACLEDERNRYSYINALDIILNENFNHGLEIGNFLLLKVIENNNVGYVPGTFFKNQLVTEEKIKYIWDLLQNNIFKYKQTWELSFYNNIPDNYIDIKYIAAIKDTFKNIDYFCMLYLDNLQRFLAIDPKLFEDLLKIIFHKNESDGKIYIWDGLFSQYFSSLGEDLTLIKRSYLQQILIQNNTFDYERKGLLNILAKDSYFLIEYVEALYEKSSSRHYLDDDHTLGVVWQIGNIEPVLDKLFNLSTEKEEYIGILEHFCNSFFWGLELEMKERAKQFLLDYCKRNFADCNKMNIVVDIARHSMSGIYSEILLTFLSITQDPELFSSIYWRGTHTSGMGDVILGDIKASEWRNVLSIVENSEVGVKLLPIKQYINLQIEYALGYAQSERKRRFLERW